jgi:phosphoglycerol transferase
MTFASRKFLSSAWPYLASAGLSSIVAATVLRLWQLSHWSLPLQYSGGDYFFYLTCSKTIRQTGWFFGNPLLGAPGGMNMLDYPMCDDLNLLGLKLCNLCATNFVTALNLFYFIGFPLAAVTATAALRQLKISRAASAAAATLFALSTYHFFRMQHMFLAFYIMLPPALAIAIRLADGEDFPLGGSTGRRRSIFAALILLATVSTGIYYSCFVGFFIALGGGLGALRAGRWNRLSAPAFFLVVLLIGILLNTAPNLYHRATAGPNPQADIRLSGESEVYALRLTYLLMPVVGDRVPGLAGITREYDRTVWPSESRYAGVGLLTAAGILILLGVALAGCAGIHVARPLGVLAAFTVAGILLGTLGGFGAIFAFLVTPMIRSWGRLSICLDFFSLCALAILVDRFVAAHASRSTGKWAIAALAVLLLAAIYEQIPGLGIDEPAIAAHWNSDRNFVGQIESTVGRDAAIFQLPGVAFPEATPYGRMADYDLFRGYFHSDTLKWNYGAMRGRDNANRLAAVALHPLPQMISELRDMNFRGIYVDTFCDRPQLPDLVAQLQVVCGHSPIVSDDGRLLFFPLPSRP